MINTKILEKNIMVDEVKGLLTGLNRRIVNVKFNLASDTLEDLPEDLELLQKYLDNIKSKVESMKKTEEDGLY